MSTTDPTAISYASVGIGFSLILADAIISLVLGVGIASDLLISAGRCILQLSIMGAVLNKVFSAKSPWLVALLSFVMILLGSNEIVFGGKTKRTPRGLFLSSLVSLGCSVYPIAVFGSNLVIKHTPWWSPSSFIPIVGMITGNAISGIAVATNVLVKEVVDNKDKLETYLAHGASRREAIFPLAVEAIKLGLLPTLNQMSVIGLISIPGMMTGAILGGESTLRASQLQMAIMFLITATCLLAICLSVLVSCRTLVDNQARIRLDRVDENGSLFAFLFSSVKGVGSRVARMLGGCCGRRGARNGYEAVPTTAPTAPAGAQ